MRLRSRRLAGLGLALLGACLWLLAAPGAAQARGRHHHRHHHGHHGHHGHDGGHFGGYRWHHGHHGSYFSYYSGFPFWWSGHHHQGIAFAGPFFCGVCHYSFGLEHDFHHHLHHHHHVDYDLIPSVVVQTGFGWVFVE
jgi:hypothetical protein